MRLTRLALSLSLGALAACGGSKKPATMPAADSAAMPAEPAAPAPAEGAGGAADTTASESASAPGGGAATPAAAPPPPAPKPVTRGAKTKKSEDPDAGGE